MRFGLSFACFCYRRDFRGRKHIIRMKSFNRSSPQSRSFRLTRHAALAPLAASAPVAASDEDVLIEFKDVYKSFGDKPILRGASFKIRRGEAVGIIGASGTGKSTTLRIAGEQPCEQQPMHHPLTSHHPTSAGLLAPDSGEVKILGKSRHGLLSDLKGEEEEHLRVGMVFQNAALFDSLTVGENVGFLLYEHSQMPPDRIQAVVADSLSKVGLRGVEKLYPAELSGGMKKRVALARAVVSDTDADEDRERVIMYDEPTAGLDPVASTVVEDLMRSLHSDSMATRTSSSFESDSDSEDGTEATTSLPEGWSEASSSDGRTYYFTKEGATSWERPRPIKPKGPQSSHHRQKVTGISSYIVVTHQHSTIRRAVDRLIFLHQGKVVWEGSVKEFDTTSEPIVRQFAEGTLNGPIQYN